MSVEVKTSDDVEAVESPEPEISWEQIKEHPEVREALRRRDNATKEKRELQARLEELQAQIENSQHKQAEESGDVEKLKSSYETKVSKLAEQLQMKESLLASFAIQNTVSSAAAKALSPEGVELFLLKHKSDFEVKSAEDGTPLVGVKNSGFTVEELIEQFKEKYAGLAANPIKGGTGSKPGENVIAGGREVDVKKIDQMSPAQRREVFKDDSLRHAYYRAKTGR